MPHLGRVGGTARRNRILEAASGRGKPGEAKGSRAANQFVRQIGKFVRRGGAGRILDLADQ